jgi:signal transduction histidine kinase
MRRIVGVLRNDPADAAAQYAPNPGLAEIPSMVEKSGDRVHLQVNGRMPVVPGSLGLTCYRVVQEAVTNALKHAGPGAQITVKLDYQPQFIVLDISDDGLGVKAGNDGHGNGLRGMEERVSSMGGQLFTGPRPDGGYQVWVKIPLPNSQNPNPTTNVAVENSTVA